MIIRKKLNHWFLVLEVKCLLFLWVENLMAHMEYIPVFIWVQTTKKREIFVILTRLHIKASSVISNDAGQLCQWALKWNLIGNRLNFLWRWLGKIDLEFSDWAPRHQSSGVCFFGEISQVLVKSRTFCCSKRTLLCPMSLKTCRFYLWIK